MADKFREQLHKGATALNVIIVGIIVFFIMYKMNIVLGILGNFLHVLAPIIYGGIMAYLLLPCYNFFVRTIKQFFERKKCSPKICQWSAKLISTLLCLVIVFIVCFALLGIILPQLITSIFEIADSQTISNNIQALSDYVLAKIQQNPVLEQQATNIFNSIVAYIDEWIDESLVPDTQQLLYNLTSGLWSTVMIVKNIFIGLIIMIYLLNTKERLVAQSKKICYSLFKIEHANDIIMKTRYSHRVFGGFIGGKIIDSIIIGILAFCIFYMTKMPYVMLLSVVIGVTNIIPFFGPFIGAIPVSILVLLIDPQKCILLLLIILALQMFDGYILGPKILGKSTGLSSFWVLFAIILFGGLFGFVGMLIGVPLFAVIYSLLKDAVGYRLRRKNLPEDTLYYQNMKYIDPQTKEGVNGEENEFTK